MSDNWTYTADLESVLQQTRATDKKLLVFYGLDTIANIVCLISLAYQPLYEL